MMTILKKVHREAQTLLRIDNNDMIAPTSLTKEKKKTKQQEQQQKKPL